jgi:hypothetical protein
MLVYFASSLDSLVFEAVSSQLREISRRFRYCQWEPTLWLYGTKELASRIEYFLGGSHNRVLLPVHSRPSTIVACPPSSDERIWPLQGSSMTDCWVHLWRGKLITSNIAARLFLIFLSILLHSSQALSTEYQFPLAIDYCVAGDHAWRTTHRIHVHLALWRGNKVFR